MTTETDHNAEPLRVKDLLELLANCDPEAAVHLSIPLLAELADAEVTADNSEAVTDCGIEVTASLQGQSAAPGALANHVHIEPSAAAMQGLFALRLSAIENTAANAELGEAAEPPAGSSIVDVCLTNAELVSIRTLLRAVNASQQVQEQACTHGPLTVAGLLAMLAEDVAMCLTRPGSWEGANMASVLSSHGYNP